MINPFKSRIDRLRESAKLVSSILRDLESMCVPGVTMLALEEFVEKRLQEAGAKSANKGYHPDWAPEPYPSVLCASVNDEVCHAPPGKRALYKGDIVTFDLGLILNGYAGDAALTVAVGEVHNRKERTMRYAKKALYEAISAVKAGAPLSDIGRAVDLVCLKSGNRVFKEFGGHHIGKKMHENPLIHHTYRPDQDEIFLKEGAVLCIEPQITPGKAICGMKADGWTAYAVDGQPVAMYEHMVLVTKYGCEILTDHITYEHHS